MVEVVFRLRISGPPVVVDVHHAVDRDFKIRKVFADLGSGSLDHLQPLSHFHWGHAHRDVTVGQERDPAHRLIDDLIAHLLAVGDQIKAAASDALSVAGVEHVVQSAGTMFSVFFTGGPVRDFAEASTTDTAAYAAFFHAMLEAGVYLPPSAYEAWFLSYAHDERAVVTVLDALPAAARAAAAAQS